MACAIGHRDGPAPCWALREERLLGLVGGPLRCGLRQGGRRGAPRLLLIHGTGSSGASWLAVAQHLAPHFELLLPDLPGHGASQGFADHRASLPRMADALLRWLQQRDWMPDLVAGHSAGAAVMLQAVLAGGLAPRGLLSLNGALQPLSGLAGQVFPPLARWMAHSHWLPLLAAQRASRPAALARLIASTGSRLSDADLRRYQQLLSQPSHVRGTLDMMAHWRLEPLCEALPRLRTPLWLAAGSADGTVPWQQSAALAHRLAAQGVPVRHLALQGLGHLAQEEAPLTVAGCLSALWDQVRVTQAPADAADAADAAYPASPSDKADTAADTWAERPSGSAR